MKHGSIFFALNAEGGKAPPRVQLLPAGAQVLGRDGRWWNNPDPQAVIDRTLAKNVDLSIDENHMADMGVGRQARAMAWLAKLTLEANGETWADVEWTPEGLALVESKAYRYLSPVFSFDPTTKEITAFVGVGLTNRPNLDLAALNSESQSPEEESMKKIAAALGLPETATEDQVLVALNALQTTATNGQKVDLSLFAPRADVAAMEQRAINAETRLADQAKTDLKKRAEIAVNSAVTGRKIAPASKDQYLALCATEDGLASFEKIMATSPAVLPELPKDPVLGPGGSTALNAEDVAFARAGGYTAEEWTKLKEGSK